MKKSRFPKILVFSTLLSSSQIVFSSTVVTLGNQDFADGATPATAVFLAAGAGEPAPFDGAFIGSDVSGPNFSANWTFNYATVANVTGGSLALGIYEHESSASATPVSSFTLNGVNLTSDMNTLLTSHGGLARENNVYTLTLPSTTFAALASGTVTFALSLNGPGLGVLGPTNFNGAALDFSALTVDTQQTPPLTLYRCPWRAFYS